MLVPRYLLREDERGMSSVVVVCCGRAVETLALAPVEAAVETPALAPVEAVFVRPLRWGAVVFIYIVAYGGREFKALR